MIPGVNPRQMQQMMRQMGMSQEDLEAESVIIKTKDGRTLIFENPDVQQITMKGQITFQLSGSFSEEEENLNVEISEDDISMVIEQAGVSKEDAMKALDEANGDIAQAIVDLTK